MASKTRGQSWFVAIAFPYCSLRPRTDAAAMPMSPTSAITSKSVDTIDGRRRFHVVRLRVRPLAIFVLSRILLFVMAFSKVGLSRTIQFSFFFSFLRLAHGSQFPSRSTFDSSRTDARRMPSANCSIDKRLLHHSGLVEARGTWGQLSTRRGGGLRGARVRRVVPCVASARRLEHGAVFTFDRRPQLWTARPQWTR